MQDNLQFNLLAQKFQKKEYKELEKDIVNLLMEICIKADSNILSGEDKDILSFISFYFIKYLSEKTIITTEKVIKILKRNFYDFNELNTIATSIIDILDEAHPSYTYKELILQLSEYKKVLI